MEMGLIRTRGGMEGFWEMRPHFGLENQNLDRWRREGRSFRQKGTNKGKAEARSEVHFDGSS
jgi:hypothetical protein